MKPHFRDDRLRRRLALLGTLSWGLAAFAGETPPDLSDSEMRADLLRAVQVTPQPRQVAWQELEFIAFLHFGVNTFTDREWGTGQEDPKLFNPTALDCRQWVRVLKDAGVKMVILTAKHHDGFCLWPSHYTDHSVAQSAWKDGKGDVVRDLSQACRQAGLKLGLYLSPADLHAPSYGDTQGYNTYFKLQLKELLTKYGPISEVWFDGANPRKEGMTYDYFAWYALIRQLQPGAVIFGMGPDVRWVGNESANTRATEWSVIPSKVPLDQFHGGDLTADDLGSRAKIKGAPYLLWYPAETDVSIRPGWFYHAKEDEKVKSADTLWDMYLRNVGGNCVFLLNVPPDRRGLIHENDAAALHQLGERIRATFKDNLAVGAQTKATRTKGGDAKHSAAMTVDADADTFWTTDDWTTSAEIEYGLGAKKRFSLALLQEHLKSGQRIEACAVDAWLDGTWKELGTATTVGYKKIFRFVPVETDKVRVRILQSRVAPTLCSFGLFLEPAEAVKKP
jgi:alpha-L-fucosidase